MPENGANADHGAGHVPSERPAFYALSPGGWRDWWTLLHPPYTLWHLSYVVIGASIAPDVDVRWTGETVVAFFLAMGLAAHALDELHGRPLGTHIPSWALVGLAAVGLAGAVTLGVHGMVQVSPWIGIFIAVGAFLVVAYNLEVFGGAFHSDLWFALAWGAFPVLTAYFAQTGVLTSGAVIAAAACAVLSAAQRVLSTPVRRLRRHVVNVRGEATLDDGTMEPLDRAVLLAAPEKSLRLLSIAVPLIAAALLVSSLARGQPV